MLVLPTGQVLYTTQSQNINIYTSTGSALPAWAPNNTEDIGLGNDNALGGPAF